ncbi:YCF48-related protein [Cecembia rubra]|uniref:YCF48-related protein n=1 Tax=Cecembia rubra TaxID=1485585 RepID=UPI00271560AE|nr:YCF48-related protein [Cecembia rubra]
MRKHLYLLFFAVLFFGIAEAQTWRRLGGWGNQYTGIVWVNEEVGYISGNQIILKSIDGGLSWVEQLAPLKTRMLAVDFFNENTGMMVGESGHIFRTSNGGISWELLNIGSSVQLNKIKYVTQTRIYIIAENGEVYRSTDSGNNWVKQSVGTVADLRGLYFVNADTGYISSANGEIIRTFNGGNSWNLRTTGQSQSLNDVYFVNGLVGYSVGNRGTILRTNDAGNSWSQITSGTERNLWAVSFNRANPNIGIITGENATILRTTNAGSNFGGINVNNQETYLDIAFRTNSNVVFATGTNGFLLSSSNAGASWALRLSGREIDYTATEFRTDRIGYVIGEKGRFFFTNNGGTSFTDRSRPVSNKFNHLFFTTNALGYVCGDGGILLRTTNSGSNWTSLNPGTTENLNGLYFFNNNLGFLAGDKGFLARTVDGGTTWEKIDLGNNNINFQRLAFFNSESAILIGSNGFVSILENEVWRTINLPTSVKFTDISILDESSAVIVGQSGTAFKTTDKGSTWTSLNLPYTEHLNAVEYLDEEVGFIAGENGLMIQTKDGGLTWNKFITATFQDFTGISFGTLSNGFAVGENGTFFTYDCQVPEKPTLIFGENNVCLSTQTYTVQEVLGLDMEFEWRVDGGRIIEGQGTSRIVVEWEIPGRNAVLVRGKNFCGNSGTTGLEVIVSNTPRQINTILGEGVVCIGTSQPYSVDNILGTVFVWEVDGGNILEGQGTNRIVVGWSNTGNRSVRVTPNNPCGTGPATIKEISVTTPPAKPSPITGPERVGLTEEIYSVTNVPEVNFQWTISGQGGRILSGQGTNRITIRWEREGDFNIKVTPMNGCNEGEPSEMSVNVNIITSIGREREENKKINIYPNPSQGDFTMDLVGIGNIHQIRIINALGQELNNLIPEDGINQYQVRNLPKGLYTVIIRTRDKEFVQKVLVR